MTNLCCLRRVRVLKAIPYLLSDPGAEKAVEGVLLLVIVHTVVHNGQQPGGSLEGVGATWL